MDAVTLEALKKSIEHWEENVRAEKPEDASVYSVDCALCCMFANYTGCKGCPVAEETGMPHCIGSPWGKAERYYTDWKYNCLFKSIFRAAAQAELDFLKSLLPQEEKVDG